MWAITTGPNFKYILIFTITDDAGIFIMSTVVDPEPWMSAVCYRWFPSWTNDVVQPDGSTALSKTCTMWCWTSPATAQLSAHHIGMSQIPVVITHRPPLSSMVDLHSARAAVVRVDQPHWWSSYEKHMQQNTVDYRHRWKRDFNRISTKTPLISVWSTYSIFLFYNVILRYLTGRFNLL